MRTLSRVLLVIFAGSCTGAARAADVHPALTLRIVEPTFSDPELREAEGEPGRFALLLRKELPTPGSSFDVNVEFDHDAKRIRARATEIAPAGITSQVLTSTHLLIPLCSLSPGSWVLELWVRRGTTGEFSLAQAFVLRAAD